MRRSRDFQEVAEALEQCGFFNLLAAISWASHLPSLCLRFLCSALPVALSSSQWNDW